MARVTGVGGVFFRVEDQTATLEWYREHLGIEPEPDFPCATLRSSGGETLVWAPFPRDTAYFGDSDQELMVNYRVDDLEGMLDQLRAAGVWVDDEREHAPNGSFGWAVDADGRRFELWQPAEGH
jgi:catechol 2,3-dioxygenase-like lactoylglutathione lyase family enzyme